MYDKDAEAIEKSKSYPGYRGHAKKILSSLTTTSHWLTFSKCLFFHVKIISFDVGWTCDVTTCEKESIIFTHVLML